MRTLLVLLATVLCLALVRPSAASAQEGCHGIWTKMCPTGSSQTTDDTDIDVPPYNPVAEKLRADVETYDRAMHSIFEATPSIEGFLGRPWPADEQALSLRVSDVLTTLWPEYSANAMEADLLLAQVAFYERQNDQLRTRVASRQEALARYEEHLPSLRAQLAGTEAQLAGTRRREGELTALALAALNDRRSERSAISTLLAFSPQPVVSVSRLDSIQPITALAGARAMPDPIQNAGPTAPFAEPMPPQRQGQFAVSVPGAGSPLGEKLAMLQRVGTELQQDTNTIRSLGAVVPGRRAEYEALLSAADSLAQQVSPWADESRRIDQGIERATAQIRTSVDNQLNANRTIVTEVVADVALNHLSGEARRIIDDIAGSEGLPVRIPASGSEQFLEFARNGGRMLLPVEGHAAQWEAFIDVQEKTLSVLDRAEGFMLEAAHVMAASSPAEIEAVLERVFASVNWQTVEYVQLAGGGVLPDDEDGSVVKDAMGSWLDRLRARQTGE